jgi:hypothetical protein
MLKRTFYESFENIFKASLEIIFTGKIWTFFILKKNSKASQKIIL